SLREAIELTNGTLKVSDLSLTAKDLVSGKPNGEAPDSIEVVIPSLGEIQTILPTSPLPAITHPVILDGYNQNEAAANAPENPDIDKANLTVRIDGSLAGAGANGLTINAANCVVSGLEIVNFDGNGIEISGSNSQGNWLYGNFIGASTDPVDGRDFG